MTSYILYEAMPCPPHFKFQFETSSCSPTLHLICARLLSLQKCANKSNLRACRRQILVSAKWPQLVGDERKRTENPGHQAFFSSFSRFQSSLTSVSRFLPTFANFAFLGIPCSGRPSTFLTNQGFQQNRTNLSSSL